MPLDRLGLPIIDPAPDRPPGWEDSPVGKAVFAGAGWGAVAGLGVAQIVMADSAVDTPFGFIYRDDAVVALGLCIGSGTALGAGFGWLFVRARAWLSAR